MGHRRIGAPVVELARQRPHHAEGDGVQRFRPVQRDEARGAAAFEQDVVAVRSSQSPEVA